jgi:1-acyl-sn-glycerol-3-phosphate acyltransferase
VSGVGGWLLRRLLFAPLMPLLLVVFLICWVLIAVGSVLVWRFRALRVVSMAVVYTLGETLCIIACLVLWVVRFRFVRAHLWLLRAFLAVLVRVSGPLFGFRLVVEEPSADDVLKASEAAPIIVIARHAGPGASFVLVHLLLSRYGRHPRVVLKDQLRMDPAIDLLLTRIGCTWIPTRSAGSASLVSAAASSLGERDCIVLFPEGADWTPVRHLAAVARLRRRGLVREAKEALRMPHVLPPRPAGTIAAVQGAPAADLMVFTHCGHDELLDLGRAWEALPLKGPLQMTWWRVPAADVPRGDEDEITEWLKSTWVSIDAWVEDQQP